MSRSVWPLPKPNCRKREIAWGWKKERRSRMLSETYHPVKALSSLVRLIDMEVCIMMRKDKEGDVVLDLCRLSFFHQPKFSASLWLHSSTSWVSKVRSSKRSSYIETTDSMFWCNHWCNATCQQNRFSPVNL